MSSGWVWPVSTPSMYGALMLRLSPRLIVSAACALAADASAIVNVSAANVAAFLPLWPMLIPRRSLSPGC